MFAGLPIQGLWLILIGLFLKTAAEGSYQQVLVRQMLQGESISRFMTHEPITAPPGIWSAWFAPTLWAGIRGESGQGARWPRR